MTRLICLTALILFAATMSPRTVEAQQLNIGPGGVQYNGYGQGYYGGYGQGNRYYGPRDRVYSGYGNGPYGYGHVRQFPANGYNNGYYGNRYYGPNYAPVYSPFGFSISTF